MCKDVVPRRDEPDVLEPVLAAAHEDADADARPLVALLLVGGDGHPHGAEDSLRDLMRRLKGGGPKIWRLSEGLSPPTRVPPVRCCKQ